MPLTRIDLRKGKSPEYREALRDVVYETLNEVAGVPDDDRHEVITEHDDDSLHISPSFLGVDRSPDALLIQITFNEGRDVEKKKRLYSEIVRRLNERIGIDPADVTINLLEVKPENWSFGHGRAQYVEGE